MARPRRILIAGITFHIVQRGHDRNRTFFRDDDYRDYLLLLSRMSQRYKTSVHAYVLMTNHVHLLMTSRQDDGVSRTMQHVAGTYARRINQRLERRGSLWEGRFKSSPVDSDFYCLACYRYIELNPVRAGMVARPEDYRWSSHHENIGRRAMRVVEPHETFAALGASRAERAQRYRGIIRERLPNRTVEAIRHGTEKGLPVGRDDFKERIETKIGKAIGQRKRGRPRNDPQPASTEESLQDTRKARGQGTRRAARKGVRPRRKGVRHRKKEV